MGFNKKEKALVLLANLGEDNLNYNQVKEVLKEALIIHGVVKSFTAKDDRNYQNWLKYECMITSEGNYIYKLAEYTEEEIWQKWYYNNL